MKFKSTKRWMLKKMGSNRILEKKRKYGKTFTDETFLSFFIFLEVNMDTVEFYPLEGFTQF